METRLIQTGIQKVAEIELSYKTKVKAAERPQVKESRSAYLLFLESWDSNKIELQEQFKVLFLNKGNYVLGIYELSTGGVSGTVADPRLIFGAALKTNSSHIIMAHNHPSGNLKQSHADNELTVKIKAAGLLLEITVLDHLIITKDGYFSYADEGVL